MNYQEVINSALAYADKANAEDVVANMDTFLRVVEARVDRILQTRLQSKRARLICEDGVEYYGLPPDYGGLRDVEIITKGGGRITMRWLASEAMDAHITRNGQTPSYSVVSNQLHVWPLLDDTNVIEIAYYQRVNPINIDDPENWISRYAPDVYIHGLMVEIFAFIKDGEGATMWDQRFKQALSELDSDDARDLWSGPSPTIQVM